jgi:DNA polymerase III sliding clamp (beta) subunit (PCNA family)
MGLFLKRAKRVRVSFEGEDVMKASSLILDTELIRYKWMSVSGNYPDYEKLIPNEFNTVAHFDTVEAIKAISSLKVLADSKAYPIDLTIGSGKIVMANPDDKGQAELAADTEGEGFIRIDGSYLAQVLKACGGMVDFKFANASSPTLFATDGYQVVVMPMVTDRAKAEQKAKVAEQATAQAEPSGEAEAEPVTEPEVVTEAEAKPKRSRKREKVAVA